MYFITIPAHIYLNKELSKTTQNLYGLIISLTNQEGYCYATNKTIAKMLDCSLSSVTRGLQQLKDSNLIKIELNNLGNSRKIYTVDTQNGIKTSKKVTNRYKTKKQRVSDGEPEWLDEIIASFSDE